MRNFYIYGFKSRCGYTAKSARSYDDERRRIESWLDGYMSFTRTSDGKNVFISLDSRACPRNPLYNALRAKSFTDGDITLHFILLDILSSAKVGLPLSFITESVDKYIADVGSLRTFDESTVRKKLKEYIKEGIVESRKESKTVLYSLVNNEDVKLTADALDFFSEASLCGFLGSALLSGENKERKNVFAFKHHYIADALDSDVLCGIFELLYDKKYAVIEYLKHNSNETIKKTVVLVKVSVSVQSGRQYLTAYSESEKRFYSFRIDNILSVTGGNVCENADEITAEFEKLTPYIWGVSMGSADSMNLEHVGFEVEYSDGEQFIHTRLEREKRGGTVTKIDNNHSRFDIDIFDSNEIIPWIRTFICRITRIEFSNKKTEEAFKSDLEKMYELYSIKTRERDFP